MSCELDLGVEDVVERIWKELRLIRVYTKRYVWPWSTFSQSQKSSYLSLSFYHDSGVYFSLGKAI